MSKVEGSSLSSSPISGTPYIASKSIDADATPIISANGEFSRAASVSEAPTPAVAPLPNGIERNADGEIRLGSSSLLNVEEVVAERLKRGKIKKRTAEESELTAQTATRICSRLAEDHVMVLKPDADTPFTDATDVVKRLLPYHVYQHPMEDLIPLSRPYNKGKRKATEEDLLREEIAETKFALECWRRRTALEKRFRRARTNPGKRTASDDQAYWLAQAALESERAETAALNAELRSARQELEKIEREKRAAQAAAAAAATTPARPTYYPPQQQASTTNAYTQYRNYSYPYTQGYNSQFTYTPYAVNSTSSNTTYNAATYAPGTARTPAYTPPTSVPPAVLPTSANNSGQQTPTTTSPTTVTTSAMATASALGSLGSSTSAIPVQLPSTSLPALSALGIIPVPAASAPAAGQAQPAAVMKGTTHNGTMVSLEIHVQSLQPNQLSGLAFILSALTSRGVNVDDAGGTASNGAENTVAVSDGGTTGASASAVATAPPGGPANGAAGGEPAASVGVSSGSG